MNYKTATEIPEAVRAALEAASLFANKSVRVIDDNHDLNNEQAMEKDLREKGMVLALSPCLRSSRSDKAARRTLKDMLYAVAVRTNTTVNSRAGGTQIDHQAAVEAVEAALQAAGNEVEGTINGLELGNGESISELVKDDDGVITHQVFFLVPVLTPTKGAA